MLKGASCNFDATVHMTEILGLYIYLKCVLYMIIRATFSTKVQTSAI